MSTTSDDIATPKRETPLSRYLLLATLIAYAVVQMIWITATTLQDITLPDNLPQARAEQPLKVGLGPDEKEHFLYILSLAERGALPKPSPQWRKSPEEYVSYQAQHPPLFYMVAAIIYKIVGNAAGPTNIWYLLRALCALCGAAVIVLADKAAKLAFPDRPLVALGTGPFVAFLPMFGHMTGCVSNEPLAMVFGAAVWLQAVRLLRSETPPTMRQAIILGVTLALACLTRLTALLWLPVVVIALLAPRKRNPVVAVAGLAAFAVLLAPWLIHNQVDYGHAFLRTFDRPLLAHGAVSEFFGRGIVPAEFPVPINLAQTLLWYAGTAWMPFWLTQFYQMDLRALFLLLSVGAGILLFLKGKPMQEDQPDVPGRWILGAGFGALAFCLAALIQQELFSDWNVVLSAGRYIVAAAPATGLLFLFALSLLPPFRAAWAALVVAVLMLLFDINTALTVRRFYQDRPTQDAVQYITSVESESISRTVI